MTEQPPPSAPEPDPAAPSAPPGRGAYSFDGDQAKAALQGAHRFDIALIVIGVVAFFASFLPFYTASFGGGGLSVSASVSAWHGFFGWFGILCCLAGAVVVALAVLGIAIPVPTRLTSLAAFGLGAICLILALFVFPGGGCGGIPGCDTGHGFGYWLALLLALGGTALSFLRYQESSAAAV
jgi:hypothetical protein